jgi:hypothetical protein
VIYKLLTQGSEMGSSQKLPHQFIPSASPPLQQDPPSSLTEEEMAFLKMQEKAGKISLLHESFVNPTTTNQQTTPHDTQPFTSHQPQTQLGFGYTKHIPDTILDSKPSPQPTQPPQPAHQYDKPNSTTNSTYL